MQGRHARPLGAGPHQDRLGSDGIERLEAHFRGQAFAPHRHDTYAIGITLAGVQTFRYRGEQRHCLPGQCHVLHPDELHDGGAGTDDGFGYRIAYIDPSLIQQALGGKPLPFVGRSGARCDVACLPILSVRCGISMMAIDDVARIEIAVMAADMLATASTGRAPVSLASPGSAVARARSARRGAGEAFDG